MNEVQALAPEALCWQCDPQQFDFTTTDELEDLAEFLGQPRALEAVRFGIGIRCDGYNLYVLGPPGVGKRAIVQRFLMEKSATEPKPADWCYVNNFASPRQPRALRLPAGRGAKLVRDVDNLIEELRTAIPAALELEEHRSRIQEIEQDAKDRQERSFQELAHKALARGLQLVRTPSGFALAPVHNGEVLGPEEFEKLSEEERTTIQNVVTELQHELKELIERVPGWRRDARKKIKQLNREATQYAISHALAQVKEQYTDLPDVLAHLNAVEEDVIEHANDFSPQEEEESNTLADALASRRDMLDAYRVNLIVYNGQSPGAPVVYEDHPSYRNLMGRVEHESHMGTLHTNFMLVRPGSLHAANGGYLVIEAVRLLQQPYAWEALKRALYSRLIRVESLAETLSLVNAVTLEPEPIPLEVKIVLLGDRLLYYLLHQHDRDFAELFKVPADFDEAMDRSEANCRLYAQLIATLVRRGKHRPFAREAVARVLEHSARVASDSAKLTAHMRTVFDLIHEADYWASQDQAAIVSRDHVQRALDAQIDRAERLRDLVQEEILRGTLLIDTDGQRVGQINGLSVLDLGTYSFGRPSRITATARLGRGEVVDIEREVELGGAIHSKGVLILSSFLAARYARNHPLSVLASLVFEQSYGMIDGDSASVAEVCALLSTLSGAPLKQSLAVTGSVNQFGQVQPIGGVNEKIEGFFDICRARGLNGQQGVLIPASNVQHLMLRQDVVAAAAEGQFHVYPIETVDQAIELLTGVPAGTSDEQGQYPEGTINQRVAARLWELFELRRKLGSEEKPDKSHD